MFVVVMNFRSSEQKHMTVQKKVAHPEQAVAKAGLYESSKWMYTDVRTNLGFFSDH